MSAVGFPHAIHADTWQEMRGKQAGDSATIVTAVSLNELDNARGQGGVVNVTQLTNAQLNANLTDNAAVGNVTGNNVIDDSFSRSTGLFSIIQNTGNNVIIQDSVIVNVTILP
jgi:hypothetical protein